MPSLYHNLVEKKWIILAMVFFIGNMVSQSLLQTGAFEIYVDGGEVFSKLKTGSFPDQESMIRIAQLLQ